MARQRVLERAGWTFWRCCTSTWQLHKDEVLTELIERLTAMSIEPLGAVERVPQIVEKRLIKAPSFKLEELSGNDSSDVQPSERAAP